MDIVFKETVPYTRVKDDLIKAFPKANKDIERCENSVLKNPKIGEPCTGYGEVDIRKSRAKLKSYKIGKSKGLRFIYQYSHPYIYPILIYKKGEFKREKEVMRKAFEQMEKIEQVLNINSE
jgi:uncharacterized protein YvpB